jgi:AraC family transcriptional regulator, melibiose operon regulatory protein
VEDVAKIASLHPNYAMSLFRKSLGLTINQFITRTRLDAAQALLVSTDNDVADVAFECGFGSLSRFYDAFHDKFHLSPAKFRKLHFAPGRLQLGKAA